ncbi:MAG: oligosaccharide flippase family protein [Methanomassiliicoccaceae archaeon]|nr:oligosaccharide flippase family protein [Methanomassiliicoccaceae archaeon]
MDVSKQKQITYNTVGNMVTLFCQWLILMIIPKITDFSEAGVFAVALSICSILNIFATFSLNQYQVSDQYVRYSENDHRVARLITVALSFVMCLFVVLFFDYTLKQNMVIVLYMVYRNLLHYAWLHAATLQIRERFDYVGKCMILEGIVSFVSFIIPYYITNDLVLSVAVMAVLGGGIFLLSMAYLYRKTEGHRYPRHRADRSTVSSLIKVGVPLLLSAASPIIITALPKLILQMTDGDDIVGIFSTLSTPTIVIPTIITGVFTPFIVYFSNLSRKGNMPLIRRQYLKMTGLVLLLGAVCYVMSRFTAGSLFETVYGDEIAPYVRFFDILIVGIIFYSIGMWGTTVLITKDQGMAAAIAAAVSLAISFMIFFVAIPSSGMGGAAYGLIGAYGIFGLLISLCVLFLPLSDATMMEKMTV